MKIASIFSIVLVALLAPSCATRVSAGYRSYDPVYYDYHAWGPSERVYYNQWATETHRPPRDYRRLRRNEQREYWRWRHDHPDRH